MTIMQRKIFLSLLLLFAGAKATIADDPGRKAFLESDYPAAIAHYTQALESDPLNGKKGFYLGTALLAAGLHQEAVDQFQKSLSLADSSLAGQIHYNSGNALYRLGSSQEGKEKIDSWRSAIQSWQKSLLFNPKNEDAKHNIELVQKKIEQELDKQKNQEQDQEQKKEEQEQDQQQNSQCQQSSKGGDSQEGDHRSSSAEQSSDSNGSSSDNQEEGSSSSAAHPAPQDEAEEQQLSSQNESSSSGGLTPEEARQLLESYADQDHKEKGKPIRALRGVEKDW
jgi:tetratricopeptide (TPR) repeat protein